MSSTPTPPPPDPFSPAPAAYGPPPAGAGGSAATSGRQRGRRIIGAVVAIAGLIGAFACVTTARLRADDAVESLARAAVRCDTTLDFAESGDYLVFVETRGELPSVRGDCDRSGVFDLAADQAPSVDVTIVDPDGAEVPLRSRRDRESYDRAGSAGSSLAQVTISSPGDHVVRVDSGSDSVFAVAIGRDPASGVAALRVLGLVIAVLGLVAGALVAFAGRTRAAVESASPPPPPTGPVWGAPAPTGPPPMQSPSGPPAPWGSTAPQPQVPGRPPITPPAPDGSATQSPWTGAGPARQPTPPPGTWSPTESVADTPPPGTWSPTEWVADAPPPGTWSPTEWVADVPPHDSSTSSTDHAESGDDRIEPPS